MYSALTLTASVRTPPRLENISLTSHFAYELPEHCTHTFDNHTQRLVSPSFPLFGGERGFTWASRFPFVCVCLLLQVNLVILKLSLLLSIEADQ
jgi:hypothetical protein